MIYILFNISQFIEQQWAGHRGIYVDQKAKTLSRVPFFLEISVNWRRNTEIASCKEILHFLYLTC